MAAVLDTHAAVWYLLLSKELSPAALQCIRQAVGSGVPVHISAISIVEVTYLVERGRLVEGALDLMKAAIADPSAGLVVHPVDQSVAEAMQRVPRDAVPDMPDRIIAATALHLNLPLITRDRRIQAAGVRTIW